MNNNILEERSDSFFEEPNPYDYELDFLPAKKQNE
jgi:hypothetical protein